MQVKYTQADGNVIIYTANTCVVDSFIVGNTVQGETSPEQVAKFEAIPGVRKRTKHLTWRGVPNSVVTFYTVTNRTYVLDYGLHHWAKERLNEVEYQTFLAQVDGTPSTVSSSDKDNPHFMRWWKRYTSDPNVHVQE